jgi:hypothetical protein
MFRFYVQFLGDAGLLGKTTIGIDGSKFKVVNSKKNNYNQNKINKHRQFIEDKTAKYLQEFCCPGSCPHEPESTPLSQSNAINKFAPSPAGSCGHEPGLSY